MAQVVGNEPTPEFAAMMADEYRRLFGSLADESLRVVALLKLEGHSNEEIARSLDCGLRTVERKLEVIRKRWMARARHERDGAGGHPVLIRCRRPRPRSWTGPATGSRAMAGGARPDLAAYLAGLGAGAGRLGARAHRRRRRLAQAAGERPVAEDYLRPFPSDADAVLAAFETVGRTRSAGPVPDAGPPRRDAQPPGRPPGRTSPSSGSSRFARTSPANGGRPGARASRCTSRVADDAQGDLAPQLAPA